MLKAPYTSSASAVADVMIVVMPHLGILDSWLPILDELKRREAGISVSAVAPDPKLLARSQPEDFLLDRCRSLIDCVLSRSYGEPWRRFESFNQAAVYAREHAQHLYRRPIETFYARFPGLTAVLDRMTPRARVVLSDVSLLERSTMRGLRHASRKMPWFSLPHGIDPRILKLGRRTREGIKGIGITIYASSEAEARHYDESYGVPQSQVKVVGVPRHDQRWIKRLRESYRGQPDEKGRYIFLASRPVNERTFPAAQKTEALQALKTLADQLDCRVLVRLHPLETGFDKGIIENVFDKHVLGKTWSYSTLPPMVAAEGALFAVTLFSSVAIDMLAIEVPVIELCDFAGLTESPNLVHDIDGRLTSIYQQSGLVLGAANVEQLTLRAGQILDGRDAVLARLKSAYSRTYANPESSVGFIVQDILAALRE